MAVNTQLIELMKEGMEYTTSDPVSCEECTFSLKKEFETGMEYLFCSRNCFEFQVSALGRCRFHAPSSTTRNV